MAAKELNEEIACIFTQTQLQQGCSIGITRILEGGDSFEEADEALYRAKKQGKINAAGMRVTDGVMKTLRMVPCSRKAGFKLRNRAENGILKDQCCLGGAGETE